MKCIYCEDYETRGVLLCYGCQVDLFPLVSRWLYCGVCGTELSDQNAICPQCAPPPASVAMSSGESPVVPTPQLATESVPPPETTLSPAKAIVPLPPLPKEPPVTPEEIKQARRFQWIIKSLLMLLWIGVLLLLFWFGQSYMQQPPDDFLP